jgi:hypothetical protein
LSWRALEAVVAEEYRLSHIHEPELRCLLGLETSYEIDTLLKAHDLYEQYTIEDFEREALRSLGLWSTLLVIADTYLTSHLISAGPSLKAAMRGSARPFHSPRRPMRSAAENDRKNATVAHRKGLRATSTLGILEAAARRGLACCDEILVSAPTILL